MSQHSNTSREEEDDISPLAYARQNGVAHDYLDNSTQFSHIISLQATIETSLIDDPNLPRFSFGTELSVEERVVLSKDAASLLAAVSQSEAPETLDSVVSSMLDSRRTRKLKFEPPLLKTDHELDCRDFTRREGFEIKLTDVKFPLEVVNDENNEGLSWPARFWNYGPDTMRGLREERLTVNKDTLAYLQSNLKCTWTEEDGEKLWISEQISKKNTAIEPVTPPLLPMYCPPKQHEPELSSSAYHVPILSDPPSLIIGDLETIECHIFEQDVPTPIRKSMTMNGAATCSSDIHGVDGSVRLGDIYSPIAPFINSGTPPSIKVRRFRRDNLKVEGPLTPLRPTMTSTKTVRFSNIVEELDLEPGSPMQSEGLESRFFEEAFGGPYERATQQSEQEQLIEADALSRVEIPKLDFSKPDPPWKAFTQAKDVVALVSLQKSLMNDIVGGRHQPWPGAKQGHTKLGWLPFPHDLAKVAMEDEFNTSDVALECFVGGQNNEEVIDSSMLAWKPGGLRILKDEDDGEDDIELGKFLKDQPQDMPFLVKKRKMALEEGRNELSGLARPASNPRSGGKTGLSKDPPIKNTMKLSVAGEFHPFNVQNVGRLLGGNFSAENSIDNYLEIRGAKRPKLTDSSYFASKENGAQNISQLRQTPSQQNLLQLPARKSPGSRSNSLPVPTITIPTTQIHVIMSTNMYKKRDLIKGLERTLPTLTLIERDFSAHNTATWLPSSVSRSLITSPLAVEADFIVSPAMGIVITNLQNIKQKPLPGQKTKPEIRDRLEKVSARFEKLVVLVNEDRADEATNGLGPNDCLAFTEFVGFASGLDGNVTVQFIGGGEQTLAKWVMAIILQHRVTEEILSDETHWELFLRRAGMNAFAAQSILAILKAPDSVSVASPSKAAQYGLVYFVEMGRQERVLRFKHLCGVRVLERVSAVIDAKWE